MLILKVTDFDSPDKARLGFMSASYSLGCILALPFVPMINDNYGRRMSIILGSVIMIVGSILQTASQNCMSTACDTRNILLIKNMCSRNVRYRQNYPRFRYPIRHRCRLVVDRRTFVSQGKSCSNFTFQLVLVRWRHRRRGCDLWHF